ncbi:MAG: flagellar assembly protein FliW [Clostridium sp.]|nr:flagellar assembly protein FliW [Clostridium sp.]
MNITFEKGLLGLEEYKEFTLMDIEDVKPYKVLQSVKDENVGLILISPFEISKEYEVELDNNTINEIKIKSEKDIMLYTTVNINSATTNFRAPIIINIKEQLGKQIILQNEDYQIKHPISKG